MWLTIIKALVSLIPFLVDLYKEGKIKTGAYDEVLGALNDKWQERIDRARRAGTQPDDPGVYDPFDRCRSEGDCE